MKAMISFKILDKDSIEELIGRAYAELGCDRDEAAEVLSSFLSMTDDDVEVGVSAHSGCILARTFDMGRYSFVYPIMMGEGADPRSAVEEIRAYAVKEEIPLCFTDVPREDLGELLPLFRHATVDAEDPLSQSYRVAVESECGMLDEIPAAEGERISLGPITERDAHAMAALARDAETNAYWGYDYMSDVGEVDDGYFYNNACLEFSRGCAMTLAVRLDGEFIGELVIWGFDFKGGAEVAVRILPDKRGEGLGSEAMSLALSIASKIGVTVLRGRVDERNAASLGMMDKYFKRCDTSDGIIYYECEL